MTGVTVLTQSSPSGAGKITNVLARQFIHVYTVTKIPGLALIPSFNNKTTTSPSRVQLILDFLNDENLNFSKKVITRWAHIVKKINFQVFSQEPYKVALKIPVNLNYL
jgi:hypothetical protein